MKGGLQNLLSSKHKPSVDVVWKVVSYGVLNNEVGAWRDEEAVKKNIDVAILAYIS